MSPKPWDPPRVWKWLERVQRVWSLSPVRLDTFPRLPGGLRARPFSEFFFWGVSGTAREIPANGRQVTNPRATTHSQKSHEETGTPPVLRYEGEGHLPRGHLPRPAPDLMLFWALCFIQFQHTHVLAISTCTLDGQPNVHALINLLLSIGHWLPNLANFRQVLRTRQST